jgi:hypothetical protein
MARHQNINDIVWRSLTHAGVHSVKEPQGLSRTDGKRPDGLTLVPWRNGKNMTWDVTIADSLAASHLPTTSVVAGGAAATLADRKETKYASLTPAYDFTPIALETMGPIHPKATDFFNDLGNRLTAITGNPKERSHLFQRLSISIQRFNSICIQGSFINPPDDTEG